MQVILHRFYTWTDKLQFGLLKIHILVLTGKGGGTQNDVSDYKYEYFVNYKV